MKFEFFTNEIDQVLELINDVFKIKGNKELFNLQDNQKILLLKDNDLVVGMTLITLKEDPFKNKKTYYLDYVCIKEEYRHKSLGRKMFEKVIELAKENNIDNIELTSNKERIDARKMYLDYGMVIKDTDYFILQL